MCAVVKDGLAGLIGVRQHRGVDVHDNLIAFSRRAGINTVMESRFREQRQGVRLLLADRWTVGDADLFAHRLPAGFQRS